MRCILRMLQVARLEQPGVKFTCWLCDDDSMEQLRRRIPGYVAGSKRLFSQGILKWWEVRHRRCACVCSY